MNGVRVLTVNSAAHRDRVQCSLLSGRSLSKHLLHSQVNFDLLCICNRRSVWLLVRRLGKHIVIMRT